MKVGNGGQTVPEGISATPDVAPTSVEPPALGGFSQRFPPEPDDDQEPPVPVMPTPPFPSFQSTPTLPQQLPGNGFESGRDSRAR
jgi:hypothetical protein